MTTLASLRNALMAHAAGGHRRGGRWRLSSPLMVLALSAALVACGGDDESGEGGGPGGEGSDPGVPPDLEDGWPELPALPLDEAAQLPVADVQAAATGGCLGDALGSLSGTPVAAGRTRAGAVEALWIAVADGGTERAAVQRCDEAGCACATANFGPGGATLSAPLEPLGAPVLGKKLTQQGLDAPTRLRQRNGALSVPAAALDPERFIGKRRFVVANAYGPLFGVDFTPLVALADADGRFTEAFEHPYVQARDIDAYLEGLHAADVLVWFGATVQRGVGSPKPEGMTVNRGLAGDMTYDRERVEANLLPAPLGGPGLVILAGAESFGTEAEGLPATGVAQMVRSLDVRPRAVVGFRGWVEPAAAMRASRALVAALLGGDTLDRALEAANDELVATGSAATMRTQLSDADAARWRLAGELSDGWGPTAFEPTTAQVVVNFLPGNNTQCTPPGGGAAQVPTAQRAQFFAEVELEGRFFRGSRSTNEQEFTIFGMLGGLRGGGEVQLVLQGRSDFVTDVVILGDGRFCLPGQCAGQVTPEADFASPGSRMYFTGSAQSSPFVYSGGALDGFTCDVFNASLHATGNDPSWIELRP